MCSHVLITACMEDFTWIVHLDMLTRLQTRIGRVILNNYDISIGNVFVRLGWFTVSQRVDYNILLLV